VLEEFGTDSSIHHELTVEIRLGRLRASCGCRDRQSVADFGLPMKRFGKLGPEMRQLFVTGEYPSQLRLIDLFASS
jgi:hypothetical protein